VNERVTSQETQPGHAVQAQQQMPLVDAAHAHVQHATLDDNVTAVAGRDIQSIID
jgi:hypothetical protein